MYLTKAGRRHSHDPNALGFTTATGRVCLLSIPADLRLSASSPSVNTSVVCIDVRADTQTLLTHDVEAWTLAFPHDGSMSGIWSGGDDAVLAWTPSPVKAEETQEQRFTVRKVHQAGVTAILPLCFSFLGQADQLLITGSYDDHLRVFSFKSSPGKQKLRILGEVDLSGGVWRIILLHVSGESRGDGVLFFWQSSG